MGQQVFSNYPNPEDLPWHELKGSITSVVFDETMKQSNITSTNSWFKGITGLYEISLKNLNTSALENTASMFENCSNLTNIYVDAEFTPIDPKEVESANMFYGCKSLEGGEGTKYDGHFTDATYAKIDGGKDNPGYFRVAAGDQYKYFVFFSCENPEYEETGKYIPETRKITASQAPEDTFSFQLSYDNLGISQQPEVSGMHF